MQRALGKCGGSEGGEPPPDTLLVEDVSWRPGKKQRDLSHHCDFASLHLRQIVLVAKKVTCTFHGVLDTRGRNMNINSRAAGLLKEMTSLRRDVYAIVARKAKVDTAIIMADTKLSDLGLDPFRVAETLDDLERRFDVALSVAVCETLRTCSMDYLVRTIWAERTRPDIDVDVVRAKRFS